jgi:hypothetical protein
VIIEQLTRYQAPFLAVNPTSNKTGKPLPLGAYILIGKEFGGDQQ